MAENIERMIYSKKEVQKILGAGNSTIQEFFNRERDPIPHFRIGRRIVIPCDLFHQWLNHQANHDEQDDNR